RSSASASPRAVARPTRTPVKLPGPMPTASASRSAGCAPPWRRRASTSSRSVTARDVRSPRTSPSATSALVAISVAVSNARISIRNRHDSRIASTVLDPDREPRLRERALARLRPLHEDDRAVEVRLEVTPLRGGEAAESVQVEVGDVPLARAVPMTDRERGARHGPLDAQSPAGAAHEGRLPRAELAGDGHDVADGEALGERGRDPLRLGWKLRLIGLRAACPLGHAVLRPGLQRHSVGRARDEGSAGAVRQKRPSWTAGSAITGASTWAGGSNSRPSSSGIRRKSDC